MDENPLSHKTHPTGSHQAVVARSLQVFIDSQAVEVVGSACTVGLLPEGEFKHRHVEQLMDLFRAATQPRRNSDAYTASRRKGVQ